MDPERQRPGFAARQPALSRRARAHPLMDTPVPSSPLHRFFIELRRRRVIRVAIVYAVAGWVIVEVASTVLPPLDLPDWSVRLVIVLVALGFPIAVIMRSEEHTSELQSLMRISYAVFCLKKK